MLGLLFQELIDLHFIMHLEMKLSVFKELFENNIKIELNSSKDTYSLKIYALNDSNSDNANKIILNDLDKQDNTLLHLAC